jgi:hypothetical protein
VGLIEYETVSSRVADPKIGKKITAEKKIKFFGIKNYNLPIPRPP